MDFEKLRTLGPKEATLILGMFEDGETTISRQDAARKMDTTIGSADQALRRLVSKGWLARAGKGVYLVQPAELGDRPVPEGEAYALLNATEPDAIVAYGTAAALWGLTTQLRHEITAVSARRPWVRELGPVKLRRLHCSDPDLGSNDIVEKNIRGHLVRLFGVERTAIQCIERPDLCGGEDEARDILTAASRKWDWGKLKGVLECSGKITTRQRVGHLLDARAAMPPWFRDWLLGSIPSGSRVYLVPGKKGKFDKVWQVIA